jgi:hypothetical protein
MKNDLIEGRLRDALAAHAETISASPNAWQHIQARDARFSRQQHGRFGLLGAGWLARRGVRRCAVLSAGVAVAAASVMAITLTAGSAPPALATVTTALTRTLTQSYHLTSQESIYYSQNGRILHSYHDTCTSEADPVRHLEASSCTDGSREREVGRYTYYYTPDPVHHRHWDRIASASILHPPAIGGFTAATPQQMLSQIKKADKVTVIGPVSGPGWSGTRYAFVSSSGTRPTSIEISGTVDVDRQGRARAVVLTTRFTNPLNMTVIPEVLTFSDFGAPVTVTPPPADQTFSWP